MNCLSQHELLESTALQEGNSLEAVDPPFMSPSSIYIKDEIRQEDKEVIAYHNGLQFKLQQIIEAAEDELGSREDVVQLALLATADLNGIENFLNKHIDPAALPYLTPKHPTAANIVFSIPELAEQIFSYLPTTQIWDLYQVNKSFKDIIEGSHPLQIKLFLKPAAPGKNYDLLESKQMELIDLTPLRYTGSEAHIVVALTLHRNTRILGRPFELPRIGSRRGKLLLCQPPLKHLVAFKDRFGSKVDHVRSETGITVGQVYDAAYRIVEEQKHMMQPWDRSMEITFESEALHERLRANPRRF